MLYLVYTLRQDRIPGRHLAHPAGIFAGGLIGTHLNRRLAEEGVRRIYVLVMALLPLISLYNCVTNVPALFG